MRVFVTGASGWVGSAVTAELTSAGHTVVGLARSDASAKAIRAAGAEVQRGEITDLDSLRAGAEGADGIIHTAFNHDFSRHNDAAADDAAAVQLFGDLLEGTGRPLVAASGLLGSAAVETDRPDPASNWSPRLQTERNLLSFKDRGIRSSAVRLSPSVHGDGDHGFMAVLVGVAREKAISGYVGDGSNVWPAVHRLDAAHLFRLALENAPAGTVLHAVGDEEVPLRQIAEVMGRHLNVPVQSVDPADAADHFGFLGPILSLGGRSSSVITRELFGWEPTHPGLIEDLEAGHYFRTA
ncbi:3-beta hydroxysteroid dehydrogenase [Arthrobacter livingstonensis]|uniref:3-beta hydroxysteroid dehydrogenase n=1 Tax=Arthrobacter livingstonensis TaxID=670078 RepID=A0A2V5L5G3_9MICC|nr:SDR family oxidoreductase [Arthrobacter livingstonensis]PYI66418.1 3-beta hydroxysteroid dehydrogenase [Arthrobacter livingstonensis]